MKSDTLNSYRRMTGLCRPMSLMYYQISACVTHLIRNCTTPWRPAPYASKAYNLSHVSQCHPHHNTNHTDGAVVVNSAEDCTTPIRKPGKRYSPATISLRTYARTQWSTPSSRKDLTNYPIGATPESHLKRCVVCFATNHACYVFLPSAARRVSAVRRNLSPNNLSLSSRPSCDHWPNPSQNQMNRTRVS